MAKKKTAKKTSKRTSASGKKTAGRSSASAKKSGKKTSGSGGSASAGRTVKKTAQKATGTGKTAETRKTTKKAPGKPTSKKTDPSSSSPATKTPASKKPDAKKPDATKPEPKKPGSRPTETSKPETSKPESKTPDAGASKPAAAGPASGDTGRKGVAVVEKKRSSRQKAPPVQFPSGGRLLAPGGPLRKPLIPSGPQNVIDEPLAAEQAAADGKSPFNKRQLEKFRSMLLDKRRELLGDITGLESEALKSADGADPRLGEHLEDQSSDAIDQAVSLDLAAADRRLLRMIDEALDRIDKGTYGLCVVTGKPIREERLRELPWASLSIEAARAEERRQMGRL